MDKEGRTYVYCVNWAQIRPARFFFLISKVADADFGPNLQGGGEPQLYAYVHTHGCMEHICSFIFSANKIQLKRFNDSFCQNKTNLAQNDVGRDGVYT